MSEIVFYTNPMSRGRIVRWMLEETGVPYRTEIVPFGQPMKNEEYCSINPMGKVPSIIHRQKVVTECAAICAYLADAFPQAGLAPPTLDRADYYRWMFFAAGPLEAAVSNRALGFVVPEDRRRMVGYGSFEDVVDTLEKAVGRSAYIAGERFTAADVYVGSHIGWGLQFGSIEKRPAFVDYLGRLSQRPAYQRAVELDNTAMAALPKSA
ncbi:glutathione S-transferase [Rhizobium sp. ACO-34A]|nr:glutathione S-transferase family protein [Rhizobium sp. ACO-34A]ATN34634.1 glutathione S-transferase [Rhizobium sp. ACO-34A]